MKKALLIVIIAFVNVMTPSCLLEPNKEFINDTISIHDTTQIHDTSTVYKDTLFFHDTTKITKTVHDTTIKYDTLRTTITKHDTLWRHDTTKTNIFVHDTLWHHDTTKINVYMHDTTKTNIYIHDTLQTFATTTISSDLVGSWSGIVAGKSTILSIASNNVYAFTYTANIGSSSYYGKIDTYSNNLAHCIYMYGPGMIGETADWIISISNNVMTLQQTGYQMFPTSQAFTLSRIL
jgi:hypothetical protein